jgi:hypothetical protein
MSTGASCLALPSELRLKVYQNLFTTAAGVILDTVSEQHIQVFIKDNVDLQNLRGRRQCCEEALPVFYNSQVFQVEDAFYRVQVLHAP